jgi:hypothetical protein
MGEPYLALNATQSTPRAVFANVAQLCAQILHAFETARRLLLKILKIGERGKEGCGATRNLVYEVLLNRVGMVRELLEEGKRVC